MENKPLNEINILLVDDDEILREMYGKMLKKIGYEVSFAVSGKEALQQIVQKKPDLILLDLMMPDMNGVEVIKTLKKNIRRFVIF